MQWHQRSARSFRNILASCPPISTSRIGQRVSNMYGFWVTKYSSDFNSWATISKVAAHFLKAGWVWQITAEPKAFQICHQNLIVYLVGSLAKSRPWRWLVFFSVLKGPKDLLEGFFVETTTFLMAPKAYRIWKKNVWAVNTGSRRRKSNLFPLFLFSVYFLYICNTAYLLIPPVVNLEPSDQRSLELPGFVNFRRIFWICKKNCLFSIVGS